MDSFIFLSYNFQQKRVYIQNKMDSIVIYKILLFKTILFYFFIQKKRIGLIWSYILKYTEFQIMKVSFNFRLYPQNALIWGHLCNFQEYMVY